MWAPVPASFDFCIRTLPIIRSSGDSALRDRFGIGVLAPYRDTLSLTFPAPTQEPLPRLIPLPERFLQEVALHCAGLL